MTPHGEPVVWVCERCGREGAAYPSQGMPRDWAKTPAGAVRCKWCGRNSVAAAKRVEKRKKKESSGRASGFDDDF